MRKTVGGLEPFTSDPQIVLVTPTIDHARFLVGRAKEDPRGRDLTCSDTGARLCAVPLG
jgi:hypothetical protein